MIVQIVDLVRAVNAWVRSAFGLAMFLSTIRKIQRPQQRQKIKWMFRLPRYIFACSFTSLLHRDRWLDTKTARIIIMAS